MTASESTFFDQRQEWSHWKHEILRRYLPKFAGILGSQHPTIYYVDAFAGAGAYGGSNPTPGSPLIAASIARDVAASGKWQYGLRCINVEPQKQNFSALCSATSDHHAPLVQNLMGTFKARLPKIIDLVGPNPALFFLDPFGYKGMEWDVIVRLAQRAATAKTELIINFMVGKVDRDAGWLDSHDQPAAPAFIKSLNELMGTDEWQAITKAGLPKEQRDDKLTRLYARRLAEAFHGIVAPYPVRTIEGRLKYYVLHVTPHRRGCRAMSDVVYRVEHDYEDEKERVQSERGRQMTLDLFEENSTPEVLADKMIAALTEQIWDTGRGRLITFGQIQNDLVIEWFGRALERHFRAACQQLIDDGRIIRDKRTGIVEKTPLQFRK
jgi:three-Cys-motif partner protein